MIAEGIKAIEELAKLADFPCLQHPEQEPDHVYLLNGEPRIAEPKPRLHQAADLSAVVAFALRVRDNNDEMPDIRSGGTCPTVWYHRSGVVCLLDDATRRDRVELKLAYSPQLLELMALDGKRRKWEQAELILWLRVFFSGCLGEHPDFLPLLRNIRWQSSNEGAGSIQHGKASVGRAIQAELSSEKPLPEVVTFDVPVFAGCLSLVKASVPCAVEIAVKDERITLIPLAGEIENCLREAEERLGALLAKELGDAAGNRLYYGVP
jgi:hypothetical protein